MLGSAESNNMIVVGFSGHGADYRRPELPVPAKARWGDSGTMLSLDGLYRRLQKCPAALKLLLIDACRNKPLRPGQKGQDVQENARQFATDAEHQRPRGILLLSSCARARSRWRKRISATACS